MRKFLPLLLLVLILLLAACATNDVEENETKEMPELFISAATSLTDAMDEIKEMYEEKNNVTLTYNFGGSGKLAQQIQQGAPIDVFISANENWLHTLMDEDLIDSDTKVDVTGNKLVLIAHKDADMNYRSFSEINTEEVKNIAVGKPESVPAGEYTEAVLIGMDKWDEIEPNIVYAQDVRQVLTYVETGNAEIGFVYESDALSSDQVKVLAELDPSMHDAIVYPGGVTTNSEHKKEAEQFLEFMTSKEVQDILATYGFTK